MRHRLFVISMICLMTLTVLYPSIKPAEAGRKLPERIWTIEGVFDQTNAAEAFPTRQY